MRAHDRLLRYPLPFLLAAKAFSQSIASLPQCWQNCIGQNGFSCSESDMNCLCTLTSSTPFLPGLLICVSKSCPQADESNFDPSVFISSLQHDCSSNGNPVPSSILSDASLAAQTTGGAGVATMRYSETTTMVTGVETDSAGNRQAVTSPVVVKYPVTSTIIQSSDAGTVSSSSVTDSIETSATQSGSSSSATASSTDSAAVTSTPTSNTDTSASPSSISTSVVSSSDASYPASNAVGPSSSLTGSSSSSSNTAAAASTGSNGSPFNMQSAASQRLSSPVMLPLAALLVTIVSLRFLY